MGVCKSVCNGCVVDVDVCRVCVTACEICDNIGDKCPDDDDVTYCINFNPDKQRTILDIHTGKVIMVIL